MDHDRATHRGVRVELQAVHRRGVRAGPQLVHVGAACGARRARHRSRRQGRQHRDDLRLQHPRHRARRGATGPGRRRARHAEHRPGARRASGGGRHRDQGYPARSPARPPVRYGRDPGHRAPASAGRGGGRRAFASRARRGPPDRRPGRRCDEPGRLLLLRDQEPDHRRGRDADRAARADRRGASGRCTG